MKNEFNYESLFLQALQKIRNRREPKAQLSDIYNLQWGSVQENKLFDFEGNDLRDYSYICYEANKITIDLLQTIIFQLAIQHQYSFQPINVGTINEPSKALFGFSDSGTHTLILFKRIESNPLWICPNSPEPECVQILMGQNNCSNCKYIYLVIENAYLQVIGHNNDLNDPGRGGNFYSIKWFLSTYFGEVESDHFLECFAEYVKNVKTIIGFITVRSLTPNALINFKKILENKIGKIQYKQLTSKPRDCKNGRILNLSENEYNIIYQQFINGNAFLVLLGGQECSESFITSEWLNYSMKKAKTIDLTMIGMGYIKAVEQLLWALICLHKNENLCIINSNKSRKKIELNDISIQHNQIDTSLGSMATFVKDNPIIIREELRSSHEFIYETIFSYKTIRNRVFHKNNIHSWEKISEIHDATYRLVFLLLGAFKLNNEELFALGVSKHSLDLSDDYYKLCEYVNYHYKDLFIIDDEKGNELFFLAQADPKTEIVAGEYIEYSGVYFQPLGGLFTCQFTRENMPSKIYLGKLIEPNEMVVINPQKVRLIFENGKFVGNSIVDEGMFSI